MLTAVPRRHSVVHVTGNNETRIALNCQIALSFLSMDLDFCRACNSSLKGSVLACCLCISIDVEKASVLKILF